jgi:predicted kinase
MQDERAQLRHYRQTAVALRRRAHKTHFQDIREQLLRLARSYDRLAYTVEVKPRLWMCGAKHDAANDDVPGM